MSRRTRRNTHRHSRQRWRLPPSRAIGHWRSSPSSFDVHPNQVTTWKAQLEGSSAAVFGPGSGHVAAQPGVDVKSLNAKIGELTLENDFLEGALTKAVLLGAKQHLQCHDDS